MESGVREGAAAPRCPTCREPIVADALYCPSCKTPYHPGCLKGEGCLVAGCAGAPARAQVTTTEPYSPLWPGVYLCWAAGGLALVVANTLSHDWGTARAAGIGARLVVLVVLAFTSGTLTHDLVIRPDRRDRFGTTALVVMFATGPAAFLLSFADPRVSGGASLLGVAALFMFVVFGLAYDQEKRRAKRAFGSFIVLGTIGVLAAIAVPGFSSARERANTRACYANQKTLAGSLEMYNLDKNTKVTALDGAVWQSLKSGGYLGSIPQDPGKGMGSSASYRWTGGGNGIRCVTHGSVQ